MLSSAAAVLSLMLGMAAAAPAANASGSRHDVALVVVRPPVATGSDLSVIDAGNFDEQQARTAR